VNKTKKYTVIMVMINHLLATPCSPIERSIETYSIAHPPLSASPWAVIVSAWLWVEKSCWTLRLGTSGNVHHVDMKYWKILEATYLG
jgi:hypothetical protein